MVCLLSLCEFLFHYPSACSAMQCSSRRRRYDRISTGTRLQFYGLGNSTAMGNRVPVATPKPWWSFITASYRSLPVLNIQQIASNYTLILTEAFWLQQTAKTSQFLSCAEMCFNLSGTKISGHQKKKKGADKHYHAKKRCYSCDWTQLFFSAEQFLSRLSHTLSQTQTSSPFK